MFRQATEREPGFAAAHAGLAYGCFLAVHDDYTDDPPARLAEGMAAARQAVRLDPRDALAHAALGRILTMNGEQERAVTACDAAIELNPSLAAAYFGRGYALTMLGRAAPAVDDLSHAVALSPRDPNVWAFMCVNAWAHALAERHEAALTWAARAAGQSNTNFWAPATLAVANGNLGRAAQAREALQDALEAKADLTVDYIGRTLPFADRNIREGVFGVLRELGLPDGEEPQSAQEPPDKPSIAVLPFDNMSGDPEQEYFSDGIAEDLITALSRLPWFFVVSRNSSFAYKGRAIDVKTAARELGVRYLAGGQRAQGRRPVRITAQLIDATSDSHVWAERYDRDLSDIFALQDEVTESIVGAVGPEVLSVEAKRAQHKDAGQLDAWDCVMRGRWHLWRLGRDDLTKAQALFERAIELAPSGQFGASDLAITHLFEAYYNWTDSRARSLERMMWAAKTAVAADDHDAWAHTTLAMSHLFAHQWDQAVAPVDHAIAALSQLCAGDRDQVPDTGLHGTDRGSADMFRAGAALEPPRQLLAALADRPQLCLLHRGSLRGIRGERQGDGPPGARQPDRSPPARLGLRHDGRGGPGARRPGVLLGTGADPPGPGRQRAGAGARSRAPEPLRRRPAPGRPARLIERSDAEMSIEQYAISGGRTGRERLRILSRVLRPQTMALFERLGVAPGMACLDMGCGGGDVTFELARLVGPSGQVLGLDIDDEKLAIARQEAAAQGLENTVFRNANAMDAAEESERFDLAYARQLLCHVPDPLQVLGEMIKRVRPGGLIAVEDIDFSGYFCHPPCPAMAGYMGFVRQTMSARGGDADIGPKLPGLLMAAGPRGGRDASCPAGGAGRRDKAHTADHDGELLRIGGRRRPRRARGGQADRR